jgi:hypothetical protein
LTVGLHVAVGVTWPPIHDVMDVEVTPAAPLASHDVVAFGVGHGAPTKFDSVLGDVCNLKM